MEEKQDSPTSDTEALPAEEPVGSCDTSGKPPIRVFTPKNCFYLLLVWIGSTAYLLALVPHTEYFGDEAGWITHGTKLATALLDGDFSRDKWEVRTTYGEINLSAGKLALGLPVAIYLRHHDLSQKHWYYNWSKSHANNLYHKRFPPDDIMRVARTASAVMGGFICVLVCIFGMLLGGWAAALTATTLLLLNPVFFESASRAMTDTPYNLFLLLTVLTMTLWHFSSRPLPRFVFVALCGVLAGLAAGVKFVGLPILFAVFFLVVFFTWGMGKVRFRAAGLHVFAFFVFGMFCIYMLNPNYWPRFNNFDASELKREIHELAVEQRGVPFAKGRTVNFTTLMTSHILYRDEIREAYPQFSSAILPLGEYFFLPHRWNSLYKSLQRKNPKKAAHPEQVSYNMFFEHRAFLGEALLLLAGLIVFFRRTWAGIVKEHPEPALPLLLFFVIYTVFVFLTVKWDADRYYLPTIICAAIISGAGLSTACEWVRQKWLRRRQRRLKARTQAST